MFDMVVRIVVDIVFIAIILFLMAIGSVSTTVKFILTPIIMFLFVISMVADISDWGDDI